MTGWPEEVKALDAVFASQDPCACCVHPGMGMVDAAVLALTEEIARLTEELDEERSFDGIMRKLDTYYPLEVPYFRDSSDPGCEAMRAARQCLLATQRAEAAEAEVAALRAEVERLYEQFVERLLDAEEENTGPQRGSAWKDATETTWRQAIELFESSPLYAAHNRMEKP